MMDKSNVGSRKQQQINKASRMMFLWVAGASVIVGFSIVLAIFLGQKIIFNTKVIAKKTQTESTLRQNIATVPNLRDNIKVLDTSDALKSVRLNDSDQPIQTVLDALPADANDTALGSSLTSRIVGEVDGVTLESITVNPANSTDPTSAASSSAFNNISFSMSVSVDQSKTDALREVLRRLERSIRAFNVTSLSVESQGSKRVMSIEGYAYYEPPKTIELREETVR